MAAIQVAISQDFFTAFARVPRAQQKKVNEFVSKFRANPQASGINYEKINDAANDGYRSVRIDQNYRGIVMKPDTGNVYLLLWVDKHDDAYDWARRHKIQVNPETGSLQLYEAVHLEPETRLEPEEVHAQSATEPLIQVRDRELLRLGVPEDRLVNVQALRSQLELDLLESKLPVEVFEALCFLAEGLPLDEVLEEYALPDGPAKVDTTDFDAALARTQSQRRFRVIEDDQELQRMLDAPLEQWRVFLHPTQRKLVERHWNGPVRVLGGAGTGKTVVAMHRARWLVKHVLQPGEKLLFTTFTRNLAADIEVNLRKICSSEQMQKIEVTNIDAWVSRFLKREKHPANIVYSGMDLYERCWSRAMQLADPELTLPDTFYEEEWQRVVLPQRIITRQDYFKASRIGRGVALSRKQRAMLWPVFEEMRLQLHQAGAMCSEDAVYTVLDMLDDGTAVRPYRAAVVDEAQDFGAESLRLIRALVPDGKQDDLMVVGDGHQRIYGRKAVLGQCGINIRGRGRKLRINYRTTEQIRRFATAVLEGIDVDDLDDGNDPITGYRSLIMGEPPVLRGFSDAAEEAEWVVNEIQQLVSNGVSANEICVVGRTQIQLRSVIEKLKSAGVENYAISRDSTDKASIPGVRLANMHRIKGLEFRIMFLVGINAGVVPLELSLDGTEDPVEKRAREFNERALLHVAGTRAVNGLYITWYGELSRLISHPESV
ncbi:MAG: UvrD-helicase domain-containing protein [Pseudomonadota bacterium]|nr:UvrD-helicase domain-containing protein [Pseudomonadota bacterium]